MKTGMTYMRKVKKALIIGNGPSRKSIDIDNVTDMTTFGCNAIYRDHFVTKGHEAAQAALSIGKARAAI